MQFAFGLFSCSVSLLKTIQILLKSASFLPWQMPPCIPAWLGPATILQPSYPFCSANMQDLEQDFLQACAATCWPGLVWG